MRYCGIDVGQGHAYPAALDLAKREVVLPGPAPLSPGGAVRWVASHRPRVVAIDAPPRPNLRLLANRAYRKRHGIDLRGGGHDRRVAEWRLGIGGCYSTRARLHDWPGWMLTGMELFAALERRGFSTDLGRGGDLLEIHPTYGFRSLVGIRADGLRVRCDPERLLRPKLPVGSEGHRQRLALLARLLSRWNVEPAALAGRSLDWTDAILAAAIAALRHHGNAIAIAAPEADEGAIVVATPLEGAPELIGGREADGTGSPPVRGRGPAAARCGPARTARGRYGHGRP